MAPGRPKNIQWENRLAKVVIGSRFSQISPLTLYFVTSAVLIIWVLLSLIFLPLAEYAFHEDLWEHSAALKEWSKNLWNPRNPHLDIDTGSPRYMPYFFGLVILMKLFGIGALPALKVGALLNIVGFVIGVYVFFRAYFRSEWAPLLGLIVLLTVWGTGWRHSNEYQLRTLFYIASYPSMFAFALSLVSLWMGVKVLRGEGRKIASFACLPVLFALIFLSHPLTCVFALGCVGILIVTEAQAKQTDRMILAMAPLIGLAVAELWPYFSVWGVALGGVGTGSMDFANADPGGRASLALAAVWQSIFYDVRILYRLGPLLVGVVCVLALVRRRVDWFIVLGATSMLGIYFSRYVIFQDLPVWVTGRFLLFATFFLHMAFVAVLLRSGPYWQLVMSRNEVGRRARFWNSGLAVLVSGSVIWSGAFATAHFMYSMIWKKPVGEILRPIVNVLPENSIVLAEALVAWPLPTYSGKTVALYHFNPMVSDQAQRAASVLKFFDGSTSNAYRVSMMRRYKVTHVLIDVKQTPQSIMSFLRSTSTVVIRHRDYTLMKIN